ncbi:MAG: peptidylprolyl isomerase [Marinobacter sp.]|uniref:peptidylprolyl isomerase n=1 Tax=Marinobacter sp. TaxID=50741 RepID=UPI0034A05B9C
MSFLSFTLPAFLFADSGTQKANSDLPTVVIQTSEGTIQLQLRPDVAPQTVENFLTYVDSGYYEGTIFHRVIPGFMIQGGGFDENLNQKATRPPVPNEAKPTAKNLRGTVAMARTSNPDSATSQFFINLVDNAYLDPGSRGPGYTVFGRVTSGMGVVDQIAGQPTGTRNGMGDVPREAITIQNIRRAEE